jgi:hypothetical protein
MTKICSKCKVEKELCEFNRKKTSQPELRSECKECNSISSKKYREENKDKELKRHKKYREENKEILKIKYYELHKEYRQNNKDYFKQYNKNYYENNLEKIIKYKVEYNKEKRHSNPLYNLTCNIRGRISTFLKLKNISKNNKTFGIVGCTPELLKEHLEQKFKDNMSWENYGEWHIDHIIPLSSAKTDDEVYKLCHYTNLQPLWAKDNLRKSNKLDYLYVMDNSNI